MYNFEDLVNIIAKLRAPGGCPWDAEQTHESIKKNLIEEAYEALEAIDTGKGEVMADELGDLLLQIVFHAQIGKDNGEFDINDVTTAVCEKMIRRHPHVFGNVKADTSDEVLKNWDEIKKQEKKLSDVSGTLKSVSSYLPALMRASKVQDKAAKVGFDFKDATGALSKVREETEEVREALATGKNVEEEIGDLLFAAVNVARLAGITSEQALTLTTEKFISRFEYVEQNAPRPLAEMELAEMDRLWEESKKRDTK